MCHGYRKGSTIDVPEIRPNHENEVIRLIKKYGIAALNTALQHYELRTTQDQPVDVAKLRTCNERERLSYDYGVYALGVVHDTTNDSYLVDKKVDVPGMYTYEVDEPVYQTVGEDTHRVERYKEEVVITPAKKERKYRTIKTPRVKRVSHMMWDQWKKAWVDNYTDERYEDISYEYYNVDVPAKTKMVEKTRTVPVSTKKRVQTGTRKVQRQKWVPNLTTKIVQEKVHNFQTTITYLYLAPKGGRCGRCNCDSCSSWWYAVRKTLIWCE